MIDKSKPTLKGLEERVTRLEHLILGYDTVHWTKRLGVAYETPVDGEPSQCPKCGSKNIGRTPEVVSMFRSPLMCRDCNHTFGGNLQSMQTRKPIYSTVWQPETDIFSP